MSLIIGLDAGGTISSYKVYSTQKNICKDFSGTSVNFYSVGDDAASFEFKSVMNNIVSEFQEEVSAICIGNSALGLHDNIPSNHPFIKTIKSFTANYSLVSDLYIGLKGIGSTPAIFLISGTGSMAVAEDIKGELFSMGGWGHILGDQGSGYMIGLRGLRDAIKAYEGLIDKTPLTDLALKFFNIAKMEEIIEKVYSPLIEKKVIAGFAANVIQSAEGGDCISQKIISESIDYLVSISLKLHDKIGGGDALLGVFGGCFQKSPYFYNLFCDRIVSKTENLKVSFPKNTPVEAALLLAGEIAGVPATVLGV